MTDRKDRLTDRQKQILHLVGQNYTSKEIARDLGISPATVNNHMVAAIQALGVTSRAEAARIVAPNGASYKFTSEPPALSYPEKSSILSGSAASDEQGALSHLFALPPIGGRVNGLSWTERTTRMLQIAAISLAVVTALALVIAGLMTVFS